MAGSERNRNADRRRGSDGICAATSGNGGQRAQRGGCGFRE